MQIVSVFLPSCLNIESVHKAIQQKRWMSFWFRAEDLLILLSSFYPAGTFRSSPFLAFDKSLPPLSFCLSPLTDEDPEEPFHTCLCLLVLTGSQGSR